MYKFAQKVINPCRPAQMRRTCICCCWNGSGGRQVPESPMMVLTSPHPALSWSVHCGICPLAILPPMVLSLSQLPIASPALLMVSRVPKMCCPTLSYESWWKFYQVSAIFGAALLMCWPTYLPTSATWEMTFPTSLEACWVQFFASLTKSLKLQRFIIWPFTITGPTYWACIVVKSFDLKY